MIAKDAFHDCAGITQLVIPDRINSVGSNAFSGCPAVLYASIGSSGAKALGKAGYSFYSDTFPGVLKYVYSDQELVGLSLISILQETETIEIPYGVNIIGTGVCKDFASLTEVVLPATVTSIGNDAFQNCISLIEIDLPNYVTSIGSSCFSGCTVLTAVTIPDNVTAIGSSCFADCTALTAVTIPDSVTMIGGSAFKNCSLLTTLTIPEGVTVLSSSICSNCTSLSQINLPSTITKVESGVFSNCSSLAEIDLPEQITSIANAMYSGAFDNNSSKLYTALNSETAKSLSRIGKAFRVRGDRYDLKYLFTDGEVSGLELSNADKDLVTMQIPDNVTAIGSSCFADCTALTAVTIPDSVTTIGVSAFKNCSLLTTLTIPEGVTVLSSSICSNCTSLSQINLPSTITKVESGVFSNCSSLAEIDLPEQITNIANAMYSGAFDNNSSKLYTALNSETAKSLSRIGKAFRVRGDRYDLKYLFTDGEVSGLEITNADKDLAMIQIPSYVTAIGASAFDNCTLLADVFIPGSVKSIGNNAFRKCQSLLSLYIPADVESISSFAFANRNSGFVLKVPAGSYAQTYAVNSSVPYEIADVENLLTLRLPDSVENIEAEAFMRLSCQAVIIPAGCRSIGSRAFADCPYLVYVRIPASVTDIADDAFEGCGQIIFE